MTDGGVPTGAAVLFFADSTYILWNALEQRENPSTAFEVSVSLWIAERRRVRCVFVLGDLDPGVGRQAFWFVVFLAAQSGC